MIFIRRIFSVRSGIQLAVSLSVYTVEEVTHKSKCLGVGDLPNTRVLSLGGRNSVSFTLGLLLRGLAVTPFSFFNTTHDPWGKSVIINLRFTYYIKTEMHLLNPYFPFIRQRLLDVLLRS